MDRGKPIILDPNNQQFPYIPVKSQQGHVISPAQVVQMSSVGHVQMAGAGHVQMSTPGHIQTGGHSSKVIVVSSLEDLKHLQNAGQSAPTTTTGRVVHLQSSGGQSSSVSTVSGLSLPSHSVIGQTGHHVVAASGDGQLQQQHCYGNQASNSQPGSHPGGDIVSTGSETQQEEEVPEVNISVNNVVCSFSTRCHVNLKRLAMEGVNVIFKRENNVVNMKLRNPRVTANIWSSGKVTCTGATSEDDSKKAARRVARILQNQGYRVRFTNYRVVNVLGTCSFPWGIKLNSFASAYPKETSYEPELHPGATYRIKQPKATLKVFSTGSITITAPSVANLQNAVEHIFPLVYPYRLHKDKLDPQEVRRLQGYSEKRSLSYGSVDKNSFKQRFGYNRERHLVDVSDDDEESFGSDSESS